MRLIGWYYNDGIDQIIAKDFVSKYTKINRLL